MTSDMISRHRKPSEVQSMGWYWFAPGDDSPKEMRRNVVAVVMVGVTFAGETVVRFPTRIVRCIEMGGQFFGPLECPF